MSANDEIQLSKEVYEANKSVFNDSRLKLDSMRLKLFIASIGLLGIFITGAVPTKLEPLGVDFSGIEQDRFLSLFSFLVLFLLLRYLILSFNFWDTRKSFLTTVDELNETVGRSSRHEYGDKSRRVLRKLSNLLSDFLIIGVPIAVGIAAFLVGQYPQRMRFIKEFFGG